MVSLTNNTVQTNADSYTVTTPGSTAGTNSADSIDSFSQQLLTALESFLNQSGNGSQVQMTIQQEPGQNSDGSQFLVTLSNPSATSNSTATSASSSSNSSSSNTTLTSSASAGSASSIFGDPGMPVTPLNEQIQSMQDSWAVLTPSQVAFQLANAAGTGGGDPTATVPGTTMTFGDLNQTQQLAYQYGVDFGTNGMSMQQFLQAYSGPDASWNLSYNQIQGNAQIQAAMEAPAGNGTNVASNSAGTSSSTSLNPDNLPNPALIQYLPADQQAAAWAALAASGEYGTGTSA